MGYDIRKFPKKFQTRFWVLGAFSFCFALFMLLYVYAGPHLKPAYFAVDNEERVYLGFNNGVYAAEGDCFYPVLTGTAQCPTITISDDDVLFIADMGDYTAVDLKSSVPEEGIIVKQTISPEQTRERFGKKSLDQYKADEQGGISYRYKKTLFEYEIVREVENGEQLLFGMPRAEYVLNMVTELGFALLMLSVVVLVATTYLYASKHPETITRVSLTRQDHKDEQNNG